MNEPPSSSATITKSRIMISCAHCGKQICLPPYRVVPGRRNFCGRDCLNAAYRQACTGENNPRYGKRKGETRTCKTCGGTFYVYPSELTKPGRTNQFCSLACRAPRLREVHLGKVVTTEQRAKQSAKMKGRKHPERVKPMHEVTCLQCEATVYLPRKLGLDIVSRRRFCSTDCWYAYVREHPDAHGSFRGGYEPYYGPNWAHQAKLARERDEHTCQDCGLRQFNPRLDVHHLVPRRAYQGDYEAANRLENLTTLCKSCHTRREAAITATLRPTTAPGSIVLWKDGTPTVYDVIG